MYGLALTEMLLLLALPVVGIAAGAGLFWVIRATGRDNNKPK
jgi:hypothetical protein